MISRGSRGILLALPDIDLPRSPWLRWNSCPPNPTHEHARLAIRLSSRGIDYPGRDMLGNLMELAGATIAG